MRTIRCHLSALLLSTLVATAQSLPPLPPGLPSAMAKSAEPTRMLTEQEKSARKAAAAETAKAVADTRVRALAEFERYRHEPLKDAAGQPVAKAGQQAERKARLETLAREGALQHARDSAEVDSWFRRQGVIRPDLVRDRPVRIENGRPVYLQSRNLGSAKMLKADKVWPGGGLSLNLDGTGVTLGLWETDYPKTNHVELAGRTLAMDNLFQSGIAFAPHATHVAGTMMAAGLNAAAKGMAFNGRILAWSLDADSVEMSQAAQSNLVFVSNHSYGYPIGWQLKGDYWQLEGDSTQSLAWEDRRYGAYTERSSQLDGIVHTAGDLLPVWAAGNDRGVVAPVPPGDLPRYGPGRRYWDRPNQTWVLVPNSVPALYNGDAGGFDTMPPDSVSKNLLTVGAIEPMAEGADPFYAQVSIYSDFGPTDDGRIKPDLVAKGSSVLSSSFDAPGLEGPDYEIISGTSFAAPSVTGSLGLILQHFGNLHGTNFHPWASTLKVLAIHTADDIAPLGPDFKTGWGLMNTERAVRLASSNALFGSRSHLKECALAQGGSIEFPLWVTNGAALLKATICWTDPAHTAMPESLDLTSSALINDIDLRIVRPDGTTNLVWILNPDLIGKDPTVRSAAATYGDNFRDNVEQTIPIANPAPGLYRLLVTHKATLRDQLGNAIPFQNVSIAASGNTPLPKPELRLEILDLGSGQVGLSWAAVVGQRYRVQYKDDVAGTTWTDVAGDIIASKPRVAVALNISGAAQRFFRVVEVE